MDKLVFSVRSVSSTKRWAKLNLFQIASDDETDGSSDRRATLVYIEQTIIDSRGETSNFKVARYKSDAILDGISDDGNNNGSRGGAAALNARKSTKEPLLIYHEVVDDQHPIQWPPDHSPIVDKLKVGDDTSKDLENFNEMHSSFLLVCFLVSTIILALVLLHLISQEKKCEVYPLDEWFNLDDPLDSDGCPNTIIFVNIFSVGIVILLIVTIFVCFCRNLRKLRKETGEKFLNIAFIDYCHLFLRGLSASCKFGGEID